MRITQKRFIIAVVLLSVLLTAGVLITVTLKKLYQLDSYKIEILAEVRKTMNREISYDRGGFSLLFGPSFTFSKVILKEKELRHPEPFISAEQISFRLALLPLLSKKIAVKEIVLKKPRINLQRYRDGTFNISDLLETESKRPIRIKGLHIKNGTLLITDQFESNRKLVHKIENIDVFVSNLTRGKKTKFRISADIVNRSVNGRIHLSGRANLAAAGCPFWDTVVDARIKGKNLDVASYWDYYRAYVPFAQILGHLDLDSTFQGKLREFSSEGEVTVRGLHFRYPQVFHVTLAPKHLAFSYSMTLSPKDVKVKAIDFSIDEFNGQGSCEILDIPSGNPRIVAHASTEDFPLEFYRQYIPFGIIPKETSEFIENSIKAATLRLDEGRLDGRVSQIARMGEGENYRVLLIKGKVLKGGLLKIGEKVPAFSDIQGELLLTGKDFVLHKMTGRFGTSPLQLEGKIADFSRPGIPTTYPFAMVMTPREPEIKWLVGDRKGAKLNYSGTSTLHLNGQGPTSNYRLNGEWLLDRAGYTYATLLKKPPGKANRMLYFGELNPEALVVSSLQYELGPLRVGLSGNYHWDEKSLAVSAGSNRFSIAALAENLPSIAAYQLRGMAQVAVQGEGNGTNLGQLNWRGNINLEEGSFIAAKHIKPITHVTGAIRIQSGTLEGSQITGMIGTTRIHGKASLTDYQNPMIRMDIACPVLEPNDFGLSHPEPDKKLTRLRVNMTWRDDNLVINNLSGYIGNSMIRLQGHVPDIKNPVLEAQVTSPELEVEDLLALARIKPLKKENVDNKAPELKLAIDADKGRWKGFEFSKLKANLTYGNQVLKMDPLLFSALRGNISVKGIADLSRDIPQYQVNFDVDKIAAEDFVTAAGWQRILVTGPVSLQGELVIQANDLPGIRKSADGTVKVNAARGTIKGYGALAKIFSILNVSQLLKFQLPDMTADGIPYNAITGTFAFKDGIASMSDLFVKSDAINIAIVGKIDMVKEEIDATYGVQPLQTVDKVVSRIPIVGWVITGKEKTLVTTYFQAKGKINDPTVTAIPFQSLATGVADIFKRIYQLPVKIFTNTGEVLIGK